MLHSSKLFKAPNQRLSHAAWKDIARALGSYSDQEAVMNAFVQQSEALQILMAELVKGKAGVRPDEPLSLESEDGVPTWLMEAWVFDGFRIIAVSKHRQGSPKGGIESRLEYIPD